MALIGRGDIAYFQVRSKADFLAYPDEPFSRIVLVPSEGIAVVHWELMVKVVVTFTNGHKSGNKMVARRVLIIERRISQPMCQRVDAECRLNK